MTELIFATAYDLANVIRQRRVSAVEALEMHLAHIARHNPAVNAIVTLDEAGARGRAQEADQALARGEIWGPLHGVPVTLKDSHSTAGLRTTVGFPALADYVPGEDGGVASRLKASGAVLMGKTNVPMLLGDIQTDNPIFGRTHNPWNLERGVGGSSGGSAAAVAAGMTPLDIGSDLGGSIRTPAHFCGVFGLKPTEHRISHVGHIPDLPDTLRATRIMSVMGPLARSVEDLALAFQVLAGEDGRDTDVPPFLVREVSRPALNELRIAWAPTFPDVPVVASDIRQALEQLAAELARLGCQIEECLPEVSFDEQREVFMRLVDCIRVFAPETEAKPPVTLAEYFTLLSRRDMLIRIWGEFFAQWDVLLCPGGMTAAFPHCVTGTPLLVNGKPVDYWWSPRYADPFNLIGHPVVAIPMARDRDGLPIGVQLVGRRWGDEELLAIAEVISEVAGGFQRPPGY